MSSVHIWTELVFAYRDWGSHKATQILPVPQLTPVPIFDQSLSTEFCPPKFHLISLTILNTFWIMVKWWFPHCFNWETLFISTLKLKKKYMNFTTGLTFLFFCGITTFCGCLKANLFKAFFEGGGTWLNSTQLEYRGPIYWFPILGIDCTALWDLERMRVLWPYGQQTGMIPLAPFWKACSVLKSAHCVSGTHVEELVDKLEGTKKQ